MYASRNKKQPKLICIRWSKPIWNEKSQCFQASPSQAHSNKEFYVPYAVFRRRYPNMKIEPGECIDKGGRPIKISRAKTGNA